MAKRCEFTARALLLMNDGTLPVGTLRLYCIHGTKMKLLLKVLVVVTVLIASVSRCGFAESAGSMSSSVPAGVGDTDLSVILGRYVESVLPPEGQPRRAVEQLAETYHKSLSADGTWPDINYKDASRAKWATADHLQRVLVMAKAAVMERGRASHALDTAVLMAFRVWLQQDFRNPNWWWNQIGIPQLTGEIASLMLPELPDADREKVITIMMRTEWDTGHWTGANLTWGVTTQIVRGCLQKNPAAVREAYARMYQEIRYNPQTAEGIQQDDSFHQHGVQLYNGGYGLSFADDVGRFIAFSWGAGYQIPADRMVIFSAYILDGERWMLRGKTIDFSVVGREITREGKVVAPDDWTVGPISPVGPAYGFVQMVTLLAARPVPRQAEFAALAASLHAGAPSDGLTGNKNFWCSDYMAHRRSGYFTSVKMLSERMQDGEMVNTEGRKSVHLSDGVNLLYVTGSEYNDIFPAWDWNKLPGTTAVQGGLDLGDPRFIGARGRTKFDGGVSDGTYGIATMDLQRGSLTAYKSWFFFDEGYLALGAGITLSGDKQDVATDVNQTRLSGAVTSSLMKHSISNGSFHRTLDRPGWIYHDHVAYLFPAKTDLEMSLLPQTGRWSEIGAGSDSPVTVPTFDLWIDHGDEPKDAKYEYVVLPGVSLMMARSYSKALTIRSLVNTEEVQAGYSRAARIVEIVFRKPGELRTPVGLVHVDHACALLIRASQGGLTVTASDPAHGSFDLDVTVASSHTVLHLPDGAWVGSSVSAFLPGTPHWAE
jgi:chondroitin AC lyase